MDLQDFTKEILKGIKAALGKEYRITAEDILKNNGVMLRAFTVRHQEEQIAPCIYIDNFYREYQMGRIKIADVVEEILYLYQENSSGYTFDMDFLQDYNKARPNLQGRLIHTGKNQKLLEALPHRDFLDLSLIYLLEMPGPRKSIGYVRVSREHLEYWGVDEQCLYEAVIRNIAEPGNGVLQSMGTFLEQMAGPGIGAGALKCPAYILTNGNHQNGAVQMLNKQILKSAAQILNGDFLLLPSSVHELILMPMEQEEDGAAQARQFAAMVQEVNDTQVEEDEILSYHVYRYYRETEEIVIAA